MRATTNCLIRALTTVITNSIEIPCPQPGQPFYGQDAQYDGPQPSYQDNGDGTVTDLNTNLMWQQSDDGTTRNWQEALDYCEALTLPWGDIPIGACPTGGI